MYCTQKEYIWQRKAKPNEKSCPLQELKIGKAEYEKITKQPTKATTFDPTSIELALITRHLWIC